MWFTKKKKFLEDIDGILDKHCDIISEGNDKGKIDDETALKLYQNLMNCRIRLEEFKSKKSGKAAKEYVKTHLHHSEYYNL